MRVCVVCGGDGGSGVVVVVMVVVVCVRAWCSVCKTYEAGGRAENSAENPLKK